MAQRVITETQEVTNVEKVAPQRVIKTTTRVVPEPADEHPQKTYETKKALFHTYRVLFYLLGIIEILLGFRLLLKLMGANPLAGFANFIYTLSGPFANPFLGTVPTTVSEVSVMEWSTLFAMAVYAVIVWLIVEFFQLIKPVNPEEVEETVE